MRMTRRRTKKTEIRNDSDSVRIDIVIEIVKRLPLKDVSRFLLVSKLWSEIIRSPYFIRSFPFLFSSIQPHLLFALNSLDKDKGHHKCCDIHYVSGLICSGYGQQQLITNPRTGMSIYLPKVKSRSKIIQSFFGYDPVYGQYKVLCMSERMNDYLNVPSSEHQVFTLGGVQKVEQSWRMIECNIHHRPKTNSVCMDGVLYYGAFTGGDMLEWCLMRFDVRTEKLDLVSRLNESSIQCYRPGHSPSLIKYHGKVALAFETSLHTFELWVMEDAEKWSKIRFSIRHSMHLFGQDDDDAFLITGNIHTGEIIFAPYDFDVRFGMTHVVYYDLKTNRLRFRTVAFDLGTLFPQISVMVPFFDFVESAMLL
ncbi:Galactose oxidase/kelch beta-propeller [Arabidopsis suecica]|uniref:Galactose oxidase/kelch beta-propeller n=1 Tax=Arabidopsis suecica TaxID=45249 RepID=A0A8T2H882_ARASU|nr:Galactose oxidase/kelch beta-propeller [Arabidopsis suecica]